MELDSLKLRYHTAGLAALELDRGQWRPRSVAEQKDFQIVLSFCLSLNNEIAKSRFVNNVDRKSKLKTNQIANIQQQCSRTTKGDTVYSSKHLLDIKS